MDGKEREYRLISGSGVIDNSPTYYDVVISSHHDSLVTLKHTENGNYKIIFNKKKFPDYTVEDFATRFIDIVESELLKRRCSDER